MKYVKKQIKVTFCSLQQIINFISLDKTIKILCQESQVCSFYWVPDLMCEAATFIRESKHCGGFFHSASPINYWKLSLVIFLKLFSKTCPQDCANKPGYCVIPQNCQLRKESSIPLTFIPMLLSNLKGIVGQKPQAC